MPRKAALYIIILTALALRLYGINFGLPYIYHADEPIIVNHAMAYGTGDLNPHFFAVPPLASYTLFFLYGIYFFIGKALHIFASAEAFAIAFLKNPAYFYLIGRIFFGALAGATTALSVYVLGKRLFSEKVGLLSAVFMTTVFIHVQNSHYIYVDTIMVLFIVLTCISSLGIIQSGNSRYYIAAGILAGIATAAKYNAALVFVVILAAHFIAGRRRASAKLITSFSIMGLTFIALNPFAVLDWKNFLHAIEKQAGAEFGPGIFYHLSYSLIGGIGIALVILGLAGMSYQLFKNPKPHLAILSFPLVFYIVLCFFSQPHERYSLPLVPFFIIYGAAFIAEFIKKKYLAVLLIILIVAPNLSKSIYADYLFTVDDTRTMAKKWVDANIAPGTKLAIEHSFFCPRLNQETDQIKEKTSYVGNQEKARLKRINLEIIASKDKKPKYYLFYLKDKSLVNTGFLFERPQLSFSVPELKQNGIEYIVFHIDTKDTIRKDFYGTLLKNAVLIKEFNPYKDTAKQYADDKVIQTGGPFLGRELFSRERNGYIIKIFKLKNG